MKKLLGIVVLGLVLSGNAYAGDPYSEENRKSTFATLYNNVKEKREALGRKASEDLFLKMQNWCEDQVNLAYNDEIECLSKNDFVNAKHMFLFRKKVTESYVEKC